MTYPLKDMTDKANAGNGPSHDVWEAINRLPTRNIGQEDDLKFERDGLRLWLSRVHSDELAIEVWMKDQWQEVWRGSIR
ncbi:MAG: hypothetical protein AAF560_16650 [Acidobacteriota bacterium]